MNLSANFRIALASLQLNRLRSLLAMLGVVIGVAAVITVISIGEANRRRIEKEVERIGADIFWLQPDFRQIMVASASGQRPPRAPSAPSSLRPLQPADLHAVLTFCREVKSAAPVKTVGTTAIFRGKEFQFNCVATTAAYLQVRKLQLLAGRFLHALDDSVQNRVGVLEYSPELKNLFTASPILHERIGINGFSFIVVGIVESKTALGGIAPGGTLYLPISTLSYLGIETPNFDQIYCQASSRAKLEAAMHHATEVLRSRYEGRSLFQAENARSFFRSAENLTRTATLVTAGIAAVALVVGGIGIMNIMLVAVTERTREIGLRRTVGAKQQDIALQFLAEAITLCFIGGQIGMFAGILAAEMIVKRLQIEAAFSFTSASIGILFSVMVGILSGFFPAYKASRLSPIEALRFE
ncbi:MAG: ABC transporter permease [candidate division KSB1 bacterium]|nr:ABC transporter permease [candidate division KSB1 bacterium]